MSTLKIGNRVRYTRKFLLDLPHNCSHTLVGRVDRVIRTTPRLVYVCWDDGSYHTASEQRLEHA